MVDSFVNLFRQPDSAAVELENGWFPLEYTGGSWARSGDVSVTLSPDGERDEMPVVLAPSSTPVRLGVRPGLDAPHRRAAPPLVLPHL